MSASDTRDSCAPYRYQCLHRLRHYCHHDPNLLRIRPRPSSPRCLSSTFAVAPHSLSCVRPDYRHQAHAAGKQHHLCGTVGRKREGRCCKRVAGRSGILDWAIRKDRVVFGAI